MRSTLLSVLSSVVVLSIAFPWSGALKQGVAQVPAMNPESAALLSAKNPARLAQVMRGMMLPNSNVVFFAEGKDPANIPAARNASGAVNPLEGTYGQWEAVENSSLAIAEAATLLNAPGRVCSNGRPVPLDHSDWPKLVNDLRVAAVHAYLAAQAKNQDKLGDAGDALTTACSNCHTKYRDSAKFEDRCK